jgi:hypothetical protein
MGLGASGQFCGFGGQQRVQATQTLEAFRDRDGVAHVFSCSIHAIVSVMAGKL